jgi:hypothetical protein
VKYCNPWQYLTLFRGVTGQYGFFRFICTFSDMSIQTIFFFIFVATTRLRSRPSVLDTTSSRHNHQICSSQSLGSNNSTLSFKTFFLISMYFFLVRSSYVVILFFTPVFSGLVGRVSDTTSSICLICPSSWAWVHFTSSTLRVFQVFFLS